MTTAPESTAMLKRDEKLADSRRVMSVRVTIETASKADAELIAGSLQAKARAESSRGHGVIRLGLLTASQTEQVIKAVAGDVEAHRVSWARVRYDDEERIFRANGHRHTS
jgi:hypothetical protein